MTIGLKPVASASAHKLASPSAVKPQFDQQAAQDPIPGYLEKFDKDKLTKISRRLVENWGPRYHKKYRPYIDHRCTKADFRYPYNNLKMASKYVKR